MRKYESVLGMLCDHAGPKLPTRDLSTRRVQAFLDEQERAPNTKKSYSNQVKAFCNWLIERDVLDENPVSGVALPRVPRKHPQYLEPSEVDEFVEVIRRAEKNPKAMPVPSKWLAPIVRGNVCLGLRLREVVNLRWR